ncbi:uncharacterized protein LOC120055288 [Salvelinus namaycush]|uniref:Uncharacterized protein LOC120055288 n=1 Tax=Salvelinus namaycush TaxID=8040 RepID=A0A8U1EU79_SALNM|nr:uncharacterized protein LOC120055288 [Salvelinus namaycush]
MVLCLIIWLVLAVFCFEKVFGLESDVINLSCNYSSASTLQWYQQYPGSSPIFPPPHWSVLKPLCDSNGQTIEPIREEVYAPAGLDPRLSVKLNDEKNRVDLDISSAKEKDSAMYYCALTPTVKGDTLEDDITPTSPEEYYLEGSRAKISCNYTVKAYNLQWYRQYPGSAPQFLLLITDTATPRVVEATPPYPRMTAKLNDERTRVDLEISSAVVTDSALYYCALQPTVAGNPETL